MSVTKFGRRRVTPLAKPRRVACDDRRALATRTRHVAHTSTRLRRARRTDDMVKVTFETPTLALRAETLWRARTSAVFMACERAVFGDLDSSLPLYERDKALTRARYVVRTVPNVTLPYLARKALGIGASSGGAGKGLIETFDDFRVDEEQSTAPYLYEASLTSYSTFLSPKNSTIRGVIRCKSVDGDSCALTLKLECTIKMTGIGSILEKVLTNAIAKKFELYPKVVERYVAVMEAERRARDARVASAASPASVDSASSTSADIEDIDFHSVCSDPEKISAPEDNDIFETTELEYDTNASAASCCVPPRQIMSRRSSSVVA